MSSYLEAPLVAISIALIRALQWTIAFLALCVAPLQLLCADPYVASVSPLQGSLPETAISSAAGVRLRTIEPVSSLVRARHIGAIRLQFTKQREITWRAVVTRNGALVEDPIRPNLLRGSYRSARRAGRDFGVRPTAASIINNQLTIVAHSLPRSAARKVFRYLEIRLDLNKRDLARVRSIPSTFAAKRSCGAALPPQSTTLTRTPVIGAARALRQADLSTDTDAEFVAEYGSVANAEIAATIDAVNAIYQRDLAIDLNLLQQNAFSGESPYTATTSLPFLQQFREYTNANQHLGASDVFHLFSGKPPFSDGPAGLAFIGVVCAAPEYAYGISQDYGRAVNTVLVAHEVGHNFGADHDLASQSFIMNPTASSSLSEFSSASKAAIAAHIGDFPSCLRGVNVSYSASLRAVARSGRCDLTGRVRENGISAASGVGVRFLRYNRRSRLNDLIGESVTNSAGVARQRRVGPGLYLMTLSNDDSVSATVRCRGR